MDGERRSVVFAEQDSITGAVLNGRDPRGSKNDDIQRFAKEDRVAGAINNVWPQIREEEIRAGCVGRNPRQEWTSEAAERVTECR